MKSEPLHVGGQEPICRNLENMHLSNLTHQPIACTVQMHMAALQVPMYIFVL